MAKKASAKKASAKPAAEASASHEISQAPVLDRDEFRTEEEWRAAQHESNTLHYHNEKERIRKEAEEQEEG